MICESYNPIVAYSELRSSGKIGADMQTEQSATFTTANTLISTTLITLSLVFLFAATSILIVFSSVLIVATNVLQQTGYSWPKVVEQVSAGLQENPTVDLHEHKNILVLGLDTLETRPDSKPLTDTILIASLDTASNRVAMVSLPRDLWSDSQSMKINGLYAAALDAGLEPTEYVTTEVEQLTDVDIQHTIVITLDTVARIVDSVGGVHITVDQAFTDPLYPRSDVDVTQVSDPTLLYETVTFAEGKQIMSGQRALQYARSRHAEGPEGTDLARAARQQKLVAALAEQLISLETIRKPSVITQLGQVYTTQFESTLPLTELTATAKQLLLTQRPISFSRGAIPVFPEEQNGVLYHPPESLYQGQWVYTVRDVQLFQKFVQTALGFEELPEITPSL